MSNLLAYRINGFDKYSASDYGMKAAIAPKGCADLTVIPANAQEFIDP